MTKSGDTTLLSAVLMPYSGSSIHMCDINVCRCY